MTKIFLLLLSFILSIQISSSKSDDIAVYWGQNVNEGNLTETCATGRYSFVVIAFFSSFGNGENPQLNLAGHCNPSSSSGCTATGTQIKHCQQQGIKSSTEYLEDLAISLKSHSTDTQKVYLSAAPQCPFPGAYLGTALGKGLFDYVWVQFFNNPSCGYLEANPIGFVNAWNQWTTSINMSKIFLGLSASQEVARNGFVPADLFISKVLPTVRKSPNFGGVMLWSRNEDRLSRYSTELQFGLLCIPQFTNLCRSPYCGFQERLGYMSTDRIKVYERENLDGQCCCETICWNNCSCQAYASVNQVNNIECHIWVEGSTFTEDVGPRGSLVSFVRHKNTVRRKCMPCFLTCARL